MSTPSPDLALVRALLDHESLVRAVVSGRQRNSKPLWRRITLRYVDTSDGTGLQVTSYDDQQAHIRNVPLDEASQVLDETVAAPFANWFVETRTEQVQVRVSKRGKVFVHRTPVVRRPDRTHDRTKPRLIDASDPIFTALGVSDADGVLKPTRTDKFRQVQEFLGALHPVVDGLADPVTVVDLGCGNAYLTFAAHRYLSDVLGHHVRSIGVDAKERAREHNRKLARQLGWDEQVSFVSSTIAAASVAAGDVPDVVMALHACDTATDEAIARGVRWRAPRLLAAPCCHHDVASQLKRDPPDGALGLIVRNGILRERQADVLTDALRAAILRILGYRVDVIEFVGSRHTPRNTLIRAVRTGVPASPDVVDGYQRLCADWQVTPALATMLGTELADAGVGA